MGPFFSSRGLSGTKPAKAIKPNFMEKSSGHLCIHMLPGCMKHAQQDMFSIRQLASIPQFYPSLRFTCLGLVTTKAREKKVCRFA